MSTTYTPERIGEVLAEAKAVPTTTDESPIAEDRLSSLLRYARKSPMACGMDDIPEDEPECAWLPDETDAPWIARAPGLICALVEIIEQLVEQTVRLAHERNQRGLELGIANERAHGFEAVAELNKRECEQLRAENERMQKRLDTPMVCEFCSWQDQTGLKKHKPGECSMYVEYQCPCEDPAHA